MKKGRTFTKIVNVLPAKWVVGVHVPISARKSVFASFYFTFENWHGKTPEALWLLGFRCLHLLRQHKLVRAFACYK